MVDGIGSFAGAFGALGERWSDYAEVVRSAALRNADGAYAADDWLVDVERLAGMGLRDAARFGVAVVEALSPLAEQMRDWNDAPKDAAEGTPEDGPTGAPPGPPTDPPAGDAATT